LNLLDVINAIVPTVKGNSNIHAMWLEGSWATGENNEHSDIDAWLDVADSTPINQSFINKLSI